MDHMEEETIEQQSQPNVVSPPVCTFCDHWNPVEGRHCAAFPSALIPAQIWDGVNFHLTPVGGERTDADGRPIVFRIHRNATVAAIREANPGLAKALRSGWARN